MLCRGTRVILELTEGRDIKPPAGYGLLHDTEGKEWPKNVVLLGPFRRGGKTEEVPSRVRYYLGRTHIIHQGHAATESLPRELSAWKEVGKLRVLYYCRGGTKGPGCAHHKLNKSIIDRLLHGRGTVTVYKHGRWYRLQFPRNARMDDRGFLYP
jgi:hypothetical protein